MDSLEDRFVEAIAAAKRADSVDDAIELGKQVIQLAHELYVGDFTADRRYDLTKLRNEAVTKAKHALRRTTIARNIAETDLERRQREAERADVLAALERDLGERTVPRRPGGELHRRRRYYTELDAEEKSRLKMLRAVAAQNAANDIRPRGWSDEKLAGELADRRTEVELLSDDIAGRRIKGGPAVRQVTADNAVLRERAETILAAQRARQRAEELAAEHRRLAQHLERLEQRLTETSRVRVRRRRDLQDQIDAADDRLAEHRSALADAQAQADAAAAATGVPERDWADILREAAEPRMRHRLTTAVQNDEQAINSDRNYLHHLQRDLDRVEAEHRRREQLTPQQRAAEQAARDNPRRPRRKAPRPAITPQPGVQYRPPDLGRGRDTGPDLGL